MKEPYMPEEMPKPYVLLESKASGHKLTLDSYIWIFDDGATIGWLLTILDFVIIIRIMIRLLNDETD